MAGAGVAAGGAGAEPGGRALRDTARRERGRARTPGKDSARQVRYRDHDILLYMLEY